MTVATWDEVSGFKSSRNKIFFVNKTRLLRVNKKIINAADVSNFRWKKATTNFYLSLKFSLKVGAVAEKDSNEENQSYFLFHPVTEKGTFLWERTFEELHQVTWSAVTNQRSWNVMVIRFFFLPYLALTQVRR